MRLVLVELAVPFERATGHRLLTTFDSGWMIARRVERGETADVVLLPHAAAQRLALARKPLAGSITELASSRVGLCVRARKSYSGPLEAAEDLMTIEIGETVVVRRTKR